MRVKTHGRFNLCPSPVCNPDEGDGRVRGAGADRPPRRRSSSSRIPTCRRTRSRRRSGSFRRPRLDVGGIEYLETDDGRRVFYDINANSNLRPSVAAAFGFDPFERVVDFLEREIARSARRSGDAVDAASANSTSRSSPSPSPLFSPGGKDAELKPGEPGGPPEPRDGPPERNGGPWPGTRSTRACGGSRW